MAVPSIAELNSTPTSKQEARSALSRKKLLDAAVRLINTEGIDRLSVRSICAEAGLSTGAFYHLFDSKEDVINYYLVDTYERFKQDSAINPDSLSTIDKVCTLYRHMVKCYTETGYEFMSAFYRPTNSLLNYRTRTEHERVILEEVREYLEQGVESGQIRSDVDLDEALLEIAIRVTGAMFYWCVFKGDMDIYDIVDRNLRSYLATIAA